MTDQPRLCLAETRRGEQCGNHAVKGSDYCLMHSGKTPDAVERRVREAEEQGTRIANAIRKMLDQLDLTDTQRERALTAVPEALRTLADDRLHTVIEGLDLDKTPQELLLGYVMRAAADLATATMAALRAGVAQSDIDEAWFEVVSPGVWTAPEAVGVIRKVTLHDTRGDAETDSDD